MRLLEGEPVNQLPLIKREKPTVLSKRKDADAVNLEAARIMLQNPKLDGLERIWAEAVLAKVKQIRGELF